MYLHGYNSTHNNMCNTYGFCYTWCKVIHPIHDLHVITCSRLRCVRIFSCWLFFICNIYILCNGKVYSVVVYMYVQVYIICMYCTTHYTRCIETYKSVVTTPARRVLFIPVHTFPGVLPNMVHIKCKKQIKNNMYVEVL